MRKIVNMREHKYRDYDPEKKEIRYFDLDHYDKEEHNQWCNIMQYTGLKDKNGVEIYEGDIVAEEETVMSDKKKDKPGYIDKRIVSNFEYAGGEIGERRYGRKLYEVRWEDSSCGFEPFSDSEENCGHCGGGGSPLRMEVIGNIYENPELLDK